jgi:uncharacterized protein
LRRIRQLGTAHLVYPSANHTRFEHVLGTCHVARRILDGLRSLPGSEIDDRLVLGVCAAALVHDVGHVPFGHTFEDERRLFPRHDGPERTQYFLGDTELARVLDKHGLKDFVSSALGIGDAGDHSQFVRDVVSGTICADLLDYLARDAYFSGIRRLYDERLFRYFVVRDRRLVLCLSKRGLLREDAFSEVIHLLRLRYTLSERVYFHHAKIASGALVSKLVERAVGGGLQLEDLYPLGDDGLLDLLEGRFGDDDVLTRLLSDLRNRRLPKRAYVLTRAIGDDLQSSLIKRFHADRHERERVEAELEDELGLEPGDVIIYCPGSGMALKEADILVERGDGSVCSLKDLQLREIDELLERHRDLWRFYVLISARAAQRRDDVARACTSRFGPTSELGA